MVSSLLKLTSYEGSNGLSAQHVFIVGVHDGELPRNGANVTTWLSSTSSSAMTVGSGASTNTGCSHGGLHVTRTTSARHVAIDVARTSAKMLAHDRKSDPNRPAKGRVRTARQIMSVGLFVLI